jgi:hypothetical protein
MREQDSLLPPHLGEERPGRRTLPLRDRHDERVHVDTQLAFDGAAGSMYGVSIGVANDENIEISEERPGLPVEAGSPRAKDENLLYSRHPAKGIGEQRRWSDRLGQQRPKLPIPRQVPVGVNEPIPALGLHHDVAVPREPGDLSGHGGRAYSEASSELA